MAPLIQHEIGLREQVVREIALPAVSPESLNSPLDAALPRTAAGSSRLAARTARLHGLRLDWAELGILGLAVSSAVLSVYRLFWAIQ